MFKFKPGQKIVCIGDMSVLQNEEWVTLFGIELPAQGGVYTVRAVTCRPFGDDDDAYGVLLEEILNMPNPLHRIGGRQMEGDPGWLPPDEIAFHQDDFRPLITVEQFTTARVTEIA